MSVRGYNWEEFSYVVLEHIDGYTVPQYGDFPNDQVEQWSADDCIKQIHKYANRFGKNQPGPEDQLLDIIKMAHYASLAYEKLRSKNEQR